ncbi:hypothetical protein RO3G_11006 [Lichtheimia corymbifera JMRC:FSU:9682]|uniref:GmrSD restriction endonucleases N-terminal domain-containing protein n=1 Tax=Lichtheimia corymbifera JMRC:FSU:9682 TaxID=1263082 RepID=A0A068S993_9FUNG|nr:hypothetical protein RO3G_11006 [Lichtheimia corymbifera JMRC:FSU:9682]
MATHVDRPGSKSMAPPRINDMVNKQMINLETPYQREVVWQTRKMGDLIDTIVHNFYVPPLIFAVRKNKDNRVIRYCIDGKQRISSIVGFMNNEFPYTHVEADGTTTDYYYAESVDRNRKHKSGREYLPPDLRQRFDEFEILAVEYSNLSVEAEVEIFSRVQLGVPLTSAEKLKAHMSPTKDFCEELHTLYRKDLSFLFSDIRCRLFQHIVNLLLVLKADSPNFPVTKKNVETFLQVQTPPTDELKRKIKYVLDIVGEIARSPHSWVFTQVNGQEKGILALEFVCFGLYVSKVPRRFSRSIADFANDCHELRSYIHSKIRTKTPMMGSPSYRVAYQWLEEKLDTMGLRPAMVRTPAEPSLTPDTEEYEEDEDLLESTLAHLNTNSLLHKRKRPAVCLETPVQPSTIATTIPTATANTTTAPSHNHIPRQRPVARRGGKFPRR